MAKAIIDEQSLTDIADAIRAKNGSADTYTPSEMATAIGDLPSPTPVTKGLVFSDYDSDGYPTKAEFVGSWTEIPSAYCAYLQHGNSMFKKITSLTIPDTVTKIDSTAFISMKFVTTLNLPNNNIEVWSQSFQSLKISQLLVKKDIIIKGTQAFDGLLSLTEVLFGGNVNSITNQCFRNANACLLYDFSHCSAVPSLYSTASLGHANGCVIKVPSALLSTWQTTAVWQDLTGVVWQGV